MNMMTSQILQFAKLSKMQISKYVENETLFFLKNYSLCIKRYGMAKSWFFLKGSVRGCSVKKLFLEISQNFTWKHLCQSLFLNKVAGLRQNIAFSDPYFPVHIYDSVLICENTANIKPIFWHILRSVTYIHLSGK